MVLRDVGWRGVTLALKKISAGLIIESTEFKKVPYSKYKSKGILKDRDNKYYIPATDTIIKRIKAQKKIDPKTLIARFHYPGNLERVLQTHGVFFSRSLSRAEGWARELASLNKDKPAIIVITFSPEESMSVKPAGVLTYPVKFSYYYSVGSIFLVDNELEYFFIPEIPDDIIKSYPTDPVDWKKPVSYKSLTSDEIGDNVAFVYSAIALDELPEKTKDNISKNMARLLVEDLEFLKLAHFLEPDYWRVYDPKDVEKKVVDPEYREEYKDLAYNASNKLVKGWASTSGDSDRWAIAVQMAVQEEFKINDALIHWRDSLLADAENSFGSVKDGIKAFLRRQYDVTQTYFRKNGVTELVLFRGMGWERLTQVHPDLRYEEAWNDKIHKVTLKLQPISSFSCSFDTALEFTGDFVTSYKMVAMVKVPVERVFTSCATGFGCRQEDEVVLLGGDMDAVVYCCRGWGSGSAVYSDAFARYMYERFCEVL